jgi:LPS-assembly lipoprotein
MKKLTLLIVVLLLTACGYHLRTNNNLAKAYPEIKLKIGSQSLLKRPLINALISSGVKLVNENTQNQSELRILKDSLRKVVQSIGVKNQVQEYRLEYDVAFSIADKEIKNIHLEKDYSFDIQQISGGQQEELTLRKQLAEDMARAIIRQISIISK